jgi:hypothetical protein
MRRRPWRVCRAHVGKEVGGQVDNPGLFLCRHCEQPVILCDCVYDRDGNVDPYCKVCRGTGWVLKPGE